MTGRPDLRGVDGADEPDTAAGAPVSAESYQRLLERVPAIIYIADAGEVGRWHYVSPQIEAILGFTAGRVVRGPGAVGEAAASGGPRARAPRRVGRDR